MGAKKELEVIDVSAKAPLPQMTVVSKQDVEALKKQRELLREFVQSQLVEATEANNFEGDYGIIPGTKKRVLFKQGAEKAQRLFQLGTRFKLVDKMIEREVNFAMFTYKAEVYSLRNPEVVIAECDAAANSQEVKYKERRVWKTIKDRKGERREQVTEETPVFDVLNTLMKMAQKRALVGCTLLATGLSEYFTQDMLDEEDVKKGQTPPADGEKEPGDQATGAVERPPICCDKPMMTSKFPKSGKPEWYCMKCKTSKVKGEA